MTDLDPASSGRVCPSCGRRVPRKIAVCRCGANLASLPATEGADDRDGQTASDFADGFRSAVGIVAAVGAMLLAIYWLGRPPVRTPRPPATLPLKVMPPALEAEPAGPPRDERPSPPEPGPGATPPAPVVIERP